MPAFRLNENYIADAASTGSRQKASGGGSKHSDTLKDALAGALGGAKQGSGRERLDSGSSFKESFQKMVGTLAGNIGAATGTGGARTHRERPGAILI